MPVVRPVTRARRLPRRKIGMANHHTGGAASEFAISAQRQLNRFGGKFRDPYFGAPQLIQPEAVSGFVDGELIVAGLGEVVIAAEETRDAALEIAGLGAVVFAGELTVRGELPAAGTGLVTIAAEEVRAVELLVAGVGLVAAQAEVARLVELLIAGQGVGTIDGEIASAAADLLLRRMMGYGL